MSACDQTFYLAGLKLRSGQATTFFKGRELTVVCGERRPQDGQIHVNELERGTTVLVAGISEVVDLTWPGPGKVKREFDEAATKQLFGAAYPEVMRITAANLPPDGAKESRGYARAVADAYVRTLGPVGIAAELDGTPGALVSASPTAVATQVLGNEGAFAACCERLSRRLEVGQHTPHIQIAQLVAAADGKMDLDAIFSLEAVLWEEALGMRDRTGGEKLHRHVQRLCATHPFVAQRLGGVQEYARLVAEGTWEPGTPFEPAAESIDLHRQRREWWSFSQQPAVLECVAQFDREHSDEYRCGSSVAVVSTRTIGVPREYEDARASWCGIGADGRLFFELDAMLEPGRGAGDRPTLENWGRSRFEGGEPGQFQSVEQALEFAANLTRYSSASTREWVAREAYDAGWLLAQLRRK